MMQSRSLTLPDRYPRQRANLPSSRFHNDTFIESYNSPGVLATSQRSVWGGQTSFRVHRLVFRSPKIRSSFQTRTSLSDVLPFLSRGPVMSMTSAGSPKANNRVDATTRDTLHWLSAPLPLSLCFAGRAALHRRCLTNRARIRSGYPQGSAGRAADISSDLTGLVGDLLHLGSSWTAHLGTPDHSK